MRTLLLLSVLFSLPLAGANEWEKIHEEFGVKVYSQHTAGSELKATRGITVVDASPERVLWVLMDTEHRPEWIDRLTVSRVLERSSPHESVIYQAFAAPWYVSDRDYVFRVQVRRDVQGRVHVDMASCEHSQAPETVGVRAELIRSSYVLTPLDGGTRTGLQVEIRTDPKGWIPAWIVNLVQKTWPVKTLRGIKRQVRQTHVGEYPLPPAQEVVGSDEAALRVKRAS